MKNTLGIYVHLPFCKKRCDYCDFYSQCDLSGRLMDDYLKAIEIQLEDYFIFFKPVVDTLYIGGGTPSVLGAKRLKKLIKSVGASVKLKKDAEVTVEVNPESADARLFKHLRSVGVNRISMGVQSARDSELQALGRLHTFEDARKSFYAARKYFDNVSIDLIYGLEGQTLEDWRETLEKAVELEPDHISCYNLKIEDGTPLALRGCKQPPEDVQADMYFETVSFLGENGYGQYEISNFARPGKESRHNLKYWDLSEYLGLGSSAHSLFGGKRFSFVSNIDEYINGVKGKRPVTEELEELAYINRSGEYVMVKLRTAEGIDPVEFEHRFETSFTPYASLMEKYINMGFAHVKDGRYALTTKGFLVSNVIIGDLVNSVCGAGK